MNSSYIADLQSRTFSNMISTPIQNHSWRHFRWEEIFSQAISQRDQFSQAISQRDQFLQAISQRDQLAQLITDEFRGIVNSIDGIIEVYKRIAQRYAEQFRAIGQEKVDVSLEIKKCDYGNDLYYVHTVKVKPPSGR